MSFSLFGLGRVRKIKEEITRLKEKLAKSREAAAKAKESLRLTRDTLRQMGGHGFSDTDPGRYIAGMDARRLLSVRYLRGDGLEVGALHRPTFIVKGANTKFYDRHTREGNIKRHPELNADEIVSVDYVGDGEKLELVPDGTLDYLISNHMVEHCQDVIATLLNFWRKLRKNGVLFLTLPDKRYTFDYRRQVTPFEHLVTDHREGPAQSKYEHYVDFYNHANLPQPAKLPSAEAVQAIPDLDLHFHVWTQAEMLEMLVKLRKEFGVNWEVEAIMRNGIELVMILRKEDVESWDRADPSTKTT